MVLNRYSHNYSTSSEIYSVESCFHRSLFDASPSVYTIICVDMQVLANKAQASRFELVRYLHTFRSSGRRLGFAWL